ncbi:hypothetical protein [Fulvivirga sediminis]|nr:hypothetical protein [Fulvivirga sediminis]
MISIVFGTAVNITPVIYKNRETAVGCACVVCANAYTTGSAQIEG